MVWLGIFFAPAMTIGQILGQEATRVVLRPTEAGTMEVTIPGRTNHYYMLYRSLNLEELGEVAAMAVGKNGRSVTLRDRFAAKAHQVFYRVRELAYKDSDDIDRDGRSDINELRESIFLPGVPNGNPFNPFEKLRGDDGSYLLTAEGFEDYSLSSEQATRPGVVAITPGVTGERFLKFVSFPLYEPGPAILFMNTRVHRGHGNFLAALDQKTGYATSAVWRGELAWIQGSDPDDPGLYTFNLQPGDLPRFADIRMLYRQLTMNMPFIDGNLAFRPWDTSLVHYLSSPDLREDLVNEGIPVWIDPALEEGADATRYAALNEGEGYGLLRVFDGDERPSILDVAIFRQVPNDVPLLRGIITESPQTPLSHVNLRAVQNGNPNAFIAEATSDPRIAPLIGRYVRLAVNRDDFEIEEVTQAEVEERLNELRPLEDQQPRRDLLENKEIQSLEELDFKDAPSIGAKAANLAELISLGRAGLVPRHVFPAFGRAVPFYFYDEFMKFNGLYSAAADMMTEPGFADDPAVREAALKDFRKRLRDGEMPPWMLEDLAAAQAEFAGVGGIRCRSSTNNEDLPGFNGAGLYGSYTHYPDEGHLSKSVKQVYASLWTFIAFEHRAFYRVDHFQAAMGVLMHPNYKDEKANGVAVSHSRYGLVQAASHPFYANVQVGEDLVTNPEAFSRPEELLLPRPHFSRSFSGGRPLRLVSSNQVPLGEHVLSDAHAVLLGGYLDVIGTHFERLYPPDPDFAVEIEFKVTDVDLVIIKQVRPWVQ